MMNEAQKARVEARLQRIEGQIRGIRKMIAENRYCVDILTQTTSVGAALRGVEDLIMEQHLATCVADAMRSDDEDQKREKIEEVMGVISRFRKGGRP